MPLEVSADAVSDALDSSLVWAASGNHSIVVSSTNGSRGGDAVQLVNGSLVTALAGPSVFQVRIRAAGTAGPGSINAGTTPVVMWTGLQSNRWYSLSFRLPDALAGQALTLNAVNCLVDQALIIPHGSPLHETPLEQALDAEVWPSSVTISSTSTLGAWPGTSGLGFDGEDVAMFPALTAQNLSAALRFSVPADASPTGMSGSWWWYKSDAYAPMSVRADDMLLAQLGSDFKWERVSVHYDVAPSQLEWSRQFSHTYTPTGLHLVDKLQMTPQPAGTFSEALETTGTVSPAGWRAVGDADARVVPDAGSLVFQGGDGVSVSFSNDANSELWTVQQKSVLTATTLTAGRLRFWTRGSATGFPLLELKIDNIPLETVVGPEWTMHEFYLPNPGQATHELSLTVTVSQGGTVWFDNFTLDSGVVHEDLLETPGHSWSTSGVWGSNADYLDGEVTLQSPAGYRDGLTPLQIPAGDDAELETQVTGPGQLVIHLQEPSAEGTSFEMEIDGLRQEDEAIPLGYCQQWSLSPGPHSLRLRFRNQGAALVSGPAASGIVYSMRVVDAADIPPLAQLLENTFIEMTVRAGGTGLAGIVPSYLLWEGSLDPAWQGIIMPRQRKENTCWIEVDLPALPEPSDDGAVRCHFAAQHGGLLSVDGQPASRATRGGYSPDVFEGDDLRMYLAPIAHTVRWDSQGHRTLLAQVSYGVEASHRAAFRVQDQPRLAWVERPSAFGLWTPASGPVITGMEEDTAVPVLAGGDGSVGSIMITGPGLVSFDAAALYEPLMFEVRIDDQPGLVPLIPADQNDEGHPWKRVNLFIPAGAHTVTFANFNGDSGSQYMFLKEIGVHELADYVPWLTLHGLANLSADFAADPDADGGSNLLEYAFGTHPQQPGAPAVPTMSWENSSLQFTFPSLSYDAGEVAYRCEYSRDMAQWNHIATVRANPAGLPGPLVLWEPPAEENERVFTRVTVLMEP